eukprot:1328767-Pleurochrysis_carterae.AAC.1
MLKDCEEATRIVNAVAQLVQNNSPPGKRDPSVAVGRYVHINTSDLENAGYRLDNNGKRVELEDTRPFIKLNESD